MVGIDHGGVRGRSPGRPRLPRVPDAGLAAYPLPTIGPCALADWWGVTRETIRLWMRIGRLPVAAGGVPVAAAVAFEAWWYARGQWRLSRRDLSQVVRSARVPSV